MYQDDVKDTLRRQLDINRYQATQLGEEAVRIIRIGYYHLVDGPRIELGEKIRKSVHDTVSYPPEKLLPQTARGNHNTQIKIQNCTTLTAV